VPQGAQLRRVRDISLDRLAPAIHAALQVGAATIRNRRDAETLPALPGPNPQLWRELMGVHGTITLNVLLTFLRNRGVPVVPLRTSPSPTFQALATLVDSVPVIVLGHRIDEPGRVAFLIAHEIGHIVHGDCQPGCPVIEASDESEDDSSIEIRADAFAQALLLGQREIPEVQADNFRMLADEALRQETTEGVDAGAVIWAWAQKTRDYATAQRALAALYRNVGAQREMKRSFEAFVDIENATDSDRDLLRCVVGDLDDDAATT